MKHTKAITKVTAPQSAQLLGILQKLSLLDTGLGLINSIFGWFGKGGEGEGEGEGEA